MTKVSLDKILEVAGQIYYLPSNVNLKQSLGNFRDNASASEALSHAFYMAHLEGYNYSEIIEGMGGTPKGTISKKVNDWVSKVNGNSIAFKAFQDKHALFSTHIKDARMALIDEEVEDYFAGGEEDDFDKATDVDADLVDTQNPTPLPAEPTQTEQVSNPLFEKVAEKNVNPLGKGVSWADALKNLPDDGVPPPTKAKTKAESNTAIQPPDAKDAPTPTVAGSVVPANVNTAQFFINMLGLGAPLGGYFVSIDLDKVEALEDAHKIPTGSVEKIEKRNDQNAQRFEKDLDTQLDNLKQPLSRVLGNSGAGISPMTELIFAVVVCFGMLAFSIYAMRSANDRFLRQLQKQHKGKENEQNAGDFIEQMQNI